jgi:hypothetical protein
MMVPVGGPAFNVCTPTVIRERSRIAVAILACSPPEALRAPDPGENTAVLEDRSLSEAEAPAGRKEAQPLRLIAHGVTVVLIRRFAGLLRDL